MNTFEAKEQQTTRIVDGIIIIEDVFKPKEGDFLTARYGDFATTFILQGEYRGECKSVCYFARFSNDNTTNVNHHIGTRLKRTDSYATKTEKQALLDALSAIGYVWNAEEKRLEKRDTEIDRQN